MDDHVDIRDAVIALLFEACAPLLFDQTPEMFRQIMAAIIISKLDLIEDIKAEITKYFVCDCYAHSATQLYSTTNSMITARHSKFISIFRHGCQETINLK
jgi:hypothetical protein